MGYGLEFYGANGQLIFDSDNFGDAEVLTPRDGDPITTSNAITVAKDDLLFARASGNLFGILSYNSTHTQKTFTPAQSISYFVAKKTSTIANISGSGDYGLEIKSASGTTTFSTKRADSSVNIQRIFDDKEITHNDTVYSGGSTTDIYVSIGHMWRSVGTGTWNCYVFSSDSITFSSQITLGGMFGSSPISIPNMGSVLVASLRG